MQKLTETEPQKFRNKVLVFWEVPDPRESILLHNITSSKHFVHSFVQDPKIPVSSIRSHPPSRKPTVPLSNPARLRTPHQPPKPESRDPPLRAPQPLQQQGYGPREGERLPLLSPDLRRYVPDLATEGARGEEVEGVECGVGVGWPRTEFSSPDRIHRTRDGTFIIMPMDDTGEGTTLSSCRRGETPPTPQKGRVWSRSSSRRLQKARARRDQEQQITWLQDLQFSFRLLIFYYKKESTYIFI